MISLALSFLLVHRMISLALLSFLSQFMIPLGFFLCKLSYSLSFLNCSSILYLQAVVLSLLFLLEYLYSTSCQSLLRVVSSVSIVPVQCWVVLCCYETLRVRGSTKIVAKTCFFAKCVDKNTIILLSRKSKFYAQFRKKHFRRNSSAEDGWTAGLSLENIPWEGRL